MNMDLLFRTALFLNIVGWTLTVYMMVSYRLEEVQTHESSKLRTVREYLDSLEFNRLAINAFSPEYLARCIRQNYNDYYDLTDEEIACGLKDAYPEVSYRIAA